MTNVGVLVIVMWDYDTFKIMSTDNIHYCYPANDKGR